LPLKNACFSSACHPFYFVIIAYRIYIPQRFKSFDAPLNKIRSTSTVFFRIASEFLPSLSGRKGWRLY
jgi:hypothetical protein